MCFDCLALPTGLQFSFYRKETVLDKKQNRENSGAISQSASVQKRKQPEQIGPFYVSFWQGMVYLRDFFSGAAAPGN
jgi:hypothetical protein